MLTDHSQALTDLADTLQAHRYLWAPEPFLLREAPWEVSSPQMQAALLDLSQSQVDDLLKTPGACETWLSDQLPTLFTALRRWQPTQLSPTISLKHDPMSLGIGGRKWQQIQAFHQASQRLPAVMQCADWCGGKGYLAGYLSAHQGCCVDCLEIDDTLCAEGAERIDQFNLPVTFHRCDIMQEVPFKLLQRNERHVALHACGELHRRFLNLTMGEAEQICLSPCCFHLGASDHSQLSMAARHSALKLSANELRIPLLETVTGGQSAMRSRRTEQIWRLAYDSWRIATTGNDDYRPLRSLSKRFFKGDPADFFAWAAQQHQLSFNDIEGVDHWLNEGRQRFELSERIGIIRQGMKRYLEYFLLLDLACYCQEHGYQADIVVFCERELTPRNLALLAHRPFNEEQFLRQLQE
ncbi:MAG: hypothetical protein RL336_1505 [Pseudomonadota bacterium]|jgi:hypothetical protein